MNFWADSLPTSLLYISILLEHPVCSMGRRGGGARAAPVSVTDGRAGGRFDVERARQDAQGRILLQSRSPHPPQWPRTTSGGAREGVHLLPRPHPEPRCGARGLTRIPLRACFNNKGPLYRAVGNGLGWRERWQAENGDRELAGGKRGQRAVSGKERMESGCRTFSGVLVFRQEARKWTR